MFDNKNRGPIFRKVSVFSQNGLLPQNFWYFEVRLGDYVPIIGFSFPEIPHRFVSASVSDPSHFDVDPDPVPGIHIWEKWIRILRSNFP